MSEVAVSQPAVNVATPKSVSLTLCDGSELKVHGLKTGGLFDVVEAFDNLGIEYLPSLSLASVLTDEQRAALSAAPLADKPALLQKFQAELTPEQSEQMAAVTKQFISELLRVIARSRPLLVATVRAFTGLDHKQIEDMDPIDNMNILQAGIGLVNVEATVATALGFSKVLGGLMGTLFGRGKGLQPAAT